MCMLTCAHLEKMAEQHAASSNALVPANIGRLKKFSLPWSSAIKRVYIIAEMCAKFREVKKANVLVTSVLFSIFFKRYLQLSPIAADDPGATPPPPAILIV